MPAGRLGPEPGDMNLSTSRLGLTTSALLALLAVGTTSAAAASGDLDTMFGTRGVAVVDSGANEFVHATTVQPDGRLVGVGAMSNGTADDGFAFRLRTDGSVDPTFGFRTLRVPGTTSGATAVTLQRDGRVVAVGVDGLSRGVVWRLTATGAPDPTFGGGDGIVTVGGTPPETFHSVAVAPDGDIVVGGRATNVGATVHRFTPAGDPDMSWDGDGWLSLGIKSYAVESVAVRPDGRVLITGSLGSPHAAVVMSLTPTGTPDLAYGGGDATAEIVGLVAHGRDLALRPDGRVVVAGTVQDPDGDNDGIVVGYTASGQVDGSFGSATGVRVDTGGFERLRSVSLLPSGGAVVAGFEGNANRPLLAKLTQDGRRDASFAGNGVLVLGGPAEEASDVAAGPDGRVLLTASAAGSKADVLVYRFLGDHRPPTCHGKRATIVGTTGPDRIRGTGRRDVIVALGGRDRVLGRGGRDVICGGPGRDVLRGGPGRDRLSGGPGRDTITQGGV